MGARLKILFVDDDADIRVIVEMALRRDPGMDVRVAGSARDALTILSEREWLPDLLLVDMLMPDMTGTDLLAWVRANKWLADLPVLFVTASAWGQGRDHYRHVGAIGVIGKPFDPMTLPELIRDHWNRRND